MFRMWMILLLMSAVLEGVPEHKGVAWQLGQDPFCYANTQEMYRVAPRKDWDARAETLSRQAQSQLETSLASQEILHQTLIELDPYRDTQRIQEALPGWAKLRADRIRLVENPGERQRKPAMEAFAKAIETHLARDLDGAIQQYMRILVEHPSYMDVRNNLGLARLHKGQDLAAQMEWETLLALSPGHHGASVNLTVLHERAGRSAKARALAQVAAEKGSPSARHNEAWYISAEKRVDSERLKRIDKLVSITREHWRSSIGFKPTQELYILSRRQAESGHFLDDGLVGRWNLRAHRWSHGLAGLLFSGLAVAWVFAVGTFMRKHHESALFVFAIPVVAAYFVFFGPPGLNYLSMSLFLILSLGGGTWATHRAHKAYQNRW